ncbi:MAG: hypothetical protein FJ388_11845, partial [Verrucomicrobia bacterium]|nr:hypothetical protein [Verrucomicrobiota bacterium]
MINLAVALLTTGVSAADWEPWTSRADVKPEQLRQLADGNEATVFGVPTGQDFGLETDAPKRINRLVVRYATLHAQFLHPKPQGAAVEIWRDGQWRRVTCDARIDYARWRDLAPLQMCGSVEWTHRFAPVETTRVRLVVKDCELVRRWCGHLNYRGVVVRDLAAKFEPERDDAGLPSGKVIESAKPTLPAPVASPDGERLTDAVYRPSVSQQGDGFEIGWPRRRMVNALRVRPGSEAAAAKMMTAEPQWWDGTGFRRVEKLSRDRLASGSVAFRFLPVATARLRLPIAGVSLDSVEAWLDKEGAAFLSAAKDAPTDVLGQTALADGEPDLGRVAGVMLPTGFLKGFTGRPGDIAETMLNWNGALILRTGAGAEREHLHDRFLAFVLDDRAVGESPEEITRGLIDGWMPGLNYNLSRCNLSARMTVFTTAPADRIHRQPQTNSLITHHSSRAYADRLHWEFQAARGSRRPVQFEVVLGKRLTMYAYYTKVQAGEAHPCIFEPLEAGYRLDADGRTVRDGEGGVVLWSSVRGEWGGTALEPRLKLSVPLDPNGKAQLDLVVPHAGAKPDEPRSGANASYAKSLQLFREHWSKEVSGA